jgi:RNA recognition motif-containing protein
MAVKLYVGNLSYEVTESELNELFSPFGVLESVKVITDRLTGNSKGFGFVEMSTRQEADQAIKELNGKTVRNRAIVVNEARPPAPRGDFGGGGRSRGGHGGGFGRGQGRGQGRGPRGRR